MLVYILKDGMDIFYSYHQFNNKQEKQFLPHLKKRVSLLNFYEKNILNEILKNELKLWLTKGACDWVGLLKMFLISMPIFLIFGIYGFGVMQEKEKEIRVKKSEMLFYIIERRANLNSYIRKNEIKKTIKFSLIGVFGTSCFLALIVSLGLSLDEGIPLFILVLSIVGIALFILLVAFFLMLLDETSAFFNNRKKVKCFKK